MSFDQTNGTPKAAPARLADERILQIVGESPTGLTGKEWRLVPGPLLKGPGSTGVRMGESHDADYRHVDLEFLLSTEHPDETSLISCGTGRAADPEAAIRDAVAS